MTPEIKRVPVRVTVWNEGNRLDFRAWMDELTVTNDMPALDHVGPFPATLHNITLHAHIGGQDAPWKFRRGKPSVTA